MDRPGLALLQQIFEAGVGLFGGAEAGEHAHGPQLAAMQGGMHAARIRIFTRQAQVLFVIQVGHIQRRVKALDRFGGGGDELFLPLRHGGQGLLQAGLFPLFQRFTQVFEFFTVVHRLSFGDQRIILYRG